MAFGRRGVTLIELVITFAIVAFLSVLVVPNLGKWIQHYRLRGTVREIVSQMELAKIKALKHNLEYRVSFDLGGRKFELQRGDRSASSKDWTTESRKIPIPRQVNIHAITFPDDAAHFNPHGTASKGSVELTSTNGEKYRITVTTTTGKITTDRVN